MGVFDSTHLFAFVLTSLSLSGILFTSTSSCKNSRHSQLTVLPVILFYFLNKMLSSSEYFVCSSLPVPSPTPWSSINLLSKIYLVWISHVKEIIKSVEVFWYLDTWFLSLDRFQGSLLVYHTWAPFLVITNLYYLGDMCISFPSLYHGGFVLLFILKDFCVL